MPDRVMPGPVEDSNGVREAVCIHTKKIFDSCRDKDCIEDLRFYPKLSCVDVINHAISVKGGTAKLIHVFVDVEPVTFNRGFYTVDLRFFYCVTLQAYLSCPCPVTVEGLCVFDKRVLLFGSEGGAKTFSSENCSCACGGCAAQGNGLPTAVVEAVIYAQPLNLLETLTTKEVIPSITVSVKRVKNGPAYFGEPVLLCSLNQTEDGCAALRATRCIRKQEVLVHYCVSVKSAGT